jgi:hypothetical protein
MKIAFSQDRFQELHHSSHSIEQLYHSNSLKNKSLTNLFKIPRQKIRPILLI